MTTTTKKWSDEAVAQLLGFATSSPVTAAEVTAAAEAMQLSVRSIASKLRQLGKEVESLAVAKVPAFTTAESEALSAFLTNNAGTFTYKEVAENFADGKFTAKQIQGKALALELTSKVKATEKVEAVRKYTPEEEATFIKMANANSFIEDIAAALKRDISSIRGKALSLTRSGEIKAIPTQKAPHAVVAEDAVTALGDGITKMTVAQIAEKTGKTERGIKTILTRRGIDVADYKGHAKREKADSKLTAAA